MPQSLIVLPVCPYRVDRLVHLRTRQAWFASMPMRSIRRLAGNTKFR